VPGYPGTPINPTNPANPQSPTNPNVPSLPNPTDGTQPPSNVGQQAASPFAQGTEQGGLASRALSNNMFGDVLGTRPVRVTYTAPLRAQFSIIGTGFASDSTAVRVNPNGTGSSITFGPLSSGKTIAPFAGPFTGTDLTYSQPTSGGGATIDRAFAQATLQSLFNTSGITPEQLAQFNRLSPAERDSLVRNAGAINQQITNATRGLQVGQVTVSDVDAQLAGANVLYTAILTGETVVNLPGGGGVVGRVKLSEDNNPMPRDRLIYNYDYFDNVPFTPNGFGVSRFQFGVEKTFLNGRWSAEFRIPFAGTMNSTSTQGFETSNTELGNLRLALKRLWLQTERLTISSGIGVTLPTARDQVTLSSLDGSELFRFRNQSVNVEPFVAALFTPTDRFFSQVWGSLNVDTSGGDLSWNPTVFGGSGSSRIWDLPTLAVDAQWGYWLLQPGNGRQFGLAPFVELHWNYTILQDELVKQVGNRTQGEGLTIRGIGGNELNLTAGFYGRLSDTLTLGLGASAPLLQAPNRTFDAQVGFRMNYFFGRTARERAAASIGMY
jgi:hypothetical protein